MVKEPTTCYFYRNNLITKNGQIQKIEINCCGDYIRYEDRWHFLSPSPTNHNGSQLPTYHLILF